MPTLAEIEALGRQLLARTHHPVPRFRLLRDVVGEAPDSEALIDAHSALPSSNWYTELARSQSLDGSWGRFHSRNSTLKLPFPTTELALYRARSLGLGKKDELVGRSLRLMEDILKNKVSWQDPAEKHEGWAINIRFITAATLALFDPTNILLTELAERWVQVVNATFANGAYDAGAEQKAHLEINNIHTKGKYLKLAGLYPLILLSIPSAILEQSIEAALMNWVSEKFAGIYYVYGARMLVPPAPTNPHFHSWLNGLDLLCRFPTGRVLCAPSLNWLWQERSENGDWDFGAAARRDLAFPLSENWKNATDRKIDCSIAVLSLMRKYATTGN
jgi:hypothetical protein